MPRHPLLAGGQRSPLSRLVRQAEGAYYELDGTDLTDLVEIAHLAELLEQAAIMLRKRAEAELIRSVERRKQTEDIQVGVYTVRRARSFARRNWDHDRIGPLLMTRIVRADPKPEAIWDTFRTCAGIGHWKGDRSQQTGTFAWGVDKDDYCEAEGRETAKVILP